MRGIGSLRLAEIGIGLTAAGCFFTTVGVLFFLDRGLISMGNVRSNDRRTCCDEVWTFFVARS